MKISLVILMFLVGSQVYSQIDYTHFHQEWKRCLPDSSGKLTDTLTFAASDHMEDCMTSSYSKNLVHNNNLWYTFYPSDSMSIYWDSGAMLREDYVPDSTISTTTSYDTIVNSDGSREVLKSVFEVRVPIQYRSPGSAAAISTTSYHLDRKTHFLTVKDDKTITYKILLLSEKRMVLRRFKL